METINFIIKLIGFVLIDIPIAFVFGKIIINPFYIVIILVSINMGLITLNYAFINSDKEINKNNKTIKKNKRMVIT